MSTLNNTVQNPVSAPQSRPAGRELQPRVSLASARWSTPRTAPRLVTFSWGAVTPAGSRR